MARPCGGRGGLNVEGVNGICITGSGSSAVDKMRIGLCSPLGAFACEAVLDCVGGSMQGGLLYNDEANTIAARISGDAGNTLVFGTDNGLYTNGEPGSDPGLLGVTVDSLQPTNIIGSTYGAGYMIWPEGMLDSYEAAVNNNGISIVHVPVRRGRDKAPFAAHFRTLSTYNDGIEFETSDTMDEMMWHSLIYEPSGPILGSGLVDPYDGYFGSGMAPTPLGGGGGTTLADVFRVTARRTVLYLECKDIGASMSDTPLPSFTIASIQGLVQRWGLQKSVIIGMEGLFEQSVADRTDALAGLAACNTVGIETGVSLSTEARVDAFPPASLVAAGFTWVFIDAEIADTDPAKVTAYKTAGLQVMLTGGHRQYQWELQRTLALRGIMCPDPMYAAGKINSFRYWQPASHWGWSTPDYGRHAYDATVTGSHQRNVGVVEDGRPDIINLASDLIPPTETAPAQHSPYWVLMGEQCPIYDPARDPLDPADYGDPTSYDLEVGFSWGSILANTAAYQGVFIGNPQDRPLFTEDRANAYTRGYAILYRQNGSMSFQRYDGVPYTGAVPHAGGGPFPWQYELTWATGVPYVVGTAKHIRVQVRPGSITCGLIGSGGAMVAPRTFDATTGGGHLWRGPYAWCGRRFFGTPAVTKTSFHLFGTVGI